MSKQIEALAQKLKEASFAHHLLDNGVLLVPRVKAMNDHGFEKEQFLVTTLYEKQGAWAIIIQAKLRKIDESNPLWSLENAKTVMEAIKGMMEHQYPCIDKDGNIPFEWSVDYDFENRTMGIIVHSFFEEIFNFIFYFKIKLYICSVNNEM